jgi:choline-sulfatase
MCGVDDVDLTPDQLRAARHGYYAAISYLDERVGEVLAALRDARFDDDTIVTFTADHGEMLGERGLWYKMSFFEHSARVPLLIRMPGAASRRRVAEPVSLLDLAPTLLELTGAPWPDEHTRELDGTSLVGLMTNERDSRPGAVLAEYLAEGVTAPAVMVRRGRHKFIACPGDPEQLYDVADDPAELANLAADPDHRATVAELRDEVARYWELEELERRVLASQRERQLVMRARAEGPAGSWAFEPGAEGSPSYVRGGADLYEVQRRARLDAPGRTARRS